MQKKSEEEGSLHSLVVVVFAGLVAGVVDLVVVGVVVVVVVVVVFVGFEVEVAEGKTFEVRREITIAPNKT